MTHQYFTLRLGGNDTDMYVIPRQTILASRFSLPFASSPEVQALDNHTYIVAGFGHFAIAWCDEPPCCPSLEYLRALFGQSRPPTQSCPPARKQKNISIHSGRDVTSPEMPSILRMTSIFATFPMDCKCSSTHQRHGDSC